MKNVAVWAPEERRTLFNEVANRRDLSFDVVQKDFWVCFVLDRLFAIEDGLVRLFFKGGTSLSKCFGIIKRFSEDVDLTLSRGDLGFAHDYLFAAPTASQRNKRAKRIQATAHARVSSELFPSLTSSIEGVLGDRRRWQLSDAGKGRLVFTFPADPELTVGTYLLPEVRLEIGGLSDLEPSRTMPVTPYAADEFADEFDEPSARVRVVEARRTMCDKLLIVHRLNTTEPPLPAEQSRHYYDAVMLGRSPIRKELLEELDLLRRAITYEAFTFPRSGIDYDTLRPSDLLLTPPDDLLTSLARDYEAMNTMFFSAPPTVEELRAELSALQSELQS